jgi:phosphatidylserine/phosphatidylglycerophosphate/cardiolipin synthase-like enzyme
VLSSLSPGHRAGPVRGLRTLAEQAFSRAAGAPLIEGNAVRILRDAAENYPAWEAAIRAARHTVHLEMYIVHRDAVGRRFVDLLAAKAREGVRVRVIYDWFGCRVAAILGLFTPLEHAGGEVRVFNPPTVTAMFGWIRRNHRKLLIVDGDVAFIGGLCIGQAWEGTRHSPPWRDTAVSLRGPAVGHAELAFAESWTTAGGRMHPPPNDPDAAPHEGDVALRLIPTEPFSANLLQMDLLITALARERLWIADAYFIGHGPYADTLSRAARDGVDVRLLLPQGSDVGWTVPVSRTLYRSLLQAGVRVFEWTGSMMHAKTAVADSRWARIGSTNLNINSWLGNWELDVAIDNAKVAATMEAHFEEDLHHSTEITLGPRGRLLATLPTRRKGRARRSARRAVREVTGVARSVGAALTANRPLEDFEVVPLVILGLTGGLVAALAAWRPWVLAWPLALLLAVASVSLFSEAWRVWATGRRR